MRKAGWYQHKTSVCVKETHPSKARIGAIRGAELCSNGQWADEDQIAGDGEERKRHCAGPNGQLGGKEEPSARRDVHLSRGP
jgi:hypothetical protein